MLDQRGENITLDQTEFVDGNVPATDSDISVLTDTVEGGSNNLLCCLNVYSAISYVE